MNESQNWSAVPYSPGAMSPVGPAQTLLLSPSSLSGDTVGQRQAFTITSMDANGNVVPNLPVALTVSGVNGGQLSGTTDANGLLTLGYVGLTSGTDYVQASGSINGMRTVSNVVAASWALATSTSGAQVAPPSITSPTPADGSIVTKPVPVTATIRPPAGQSIASWSVAYQAQDPEPPVTIATGTGAPPSTLATFDPTLLPNDTYAITISATGSGGGTQTVTTTVAVYGNLKLGRYVTTYQDLNVPVNGFQMQVRRVYDSIDKRVGDFGVGWHVDLVNFRTSANRQLGAGGWTLYPTQCIFGICFYAFKSSTPHYVTVTFPDGHQEIFDFMPSAGAGILYWQGAAAFTARAGTGTTSKLEVAGDTGLSYDFAGNLTGSSGFYNPTRFKLTTRDGRVLILDTVLGLVSETDRNGNSLTVDATGVHASNGQSITYTRDSAGRITKITSPSNQVIAYSYSARGDLASSTDPNGNVTTYNYDTSHDLLSATGPGQSRPLTTLAYDSSGRLVSVTDGNGNTTQIANNVAGQQQTVTDATGLLTMVQTDDDLGDVVRRDLVASGKTLTSTYTYDAVGHLLTATDPLGHATSFAYDTSGDVVQSTDALGNTSKFAYDSTGRLLSATAPDGTILETPAYDANGNLTTLTRRDGSALAYVYDTTGRIVKATDFRGNNETVSYDALGHVAAMADPLGNTTQYTSDSSGRITTLTDPLGAVTTMTYDANGNLTSITDGLSHKRSFTYDGQDRLSSATDQTGHISTFTYDGAGNLASVTNRDGKTATFSYDADGRLTTETLPGNDVTNYTYDPLGEVLSASNTNVGQNFAYDGAGRLSSQATAPTTSSAQPSTTLSYAYDAADRLTGSTGPDGTIGYGYDTNSRLTSLTDPAGGIFSFGYDSVWRLTNLGRPNGVTDALSYDTAGNLLSRTATLGTSTLYKAAYAYDANGRRTSFTDPSGTSSQLQRGWGTDGRHPSQWWPGREQFAYDAAGNRSASASMVAGSFSYDSGNRLLSDARFTYTYDNEGDLTSKRDKSTGATTTHAWNMRHQLTSISFPDGSVTSYRYDPLGRRIESNAAGVVTRQVYDGQNLRLQYNASNTLTGSFVDAGVDGHLETTQAGQRFFYGQDGSNSTVQLTNSSGTAVASYSYDSFGNPAGANSTSPSNPFTYTGREFDAKSGLYYYRSRYYAPDQGRFLSEDAIAHVNEYAYTQSDPVDFADPSGALLTEYAVLTASPQRLNVASCISSFVGAVAEVAQAGVTAAFDQPGAAANEAGRALVAGAVTTGVTCALAGFPSDAAEEGGGMSFYRGARPGEKPSFIPKPNDFRVDPKTGYVKPTHGVSVLNSPARLTARGLDAYKVDQSSVPTELQIIQRGKQPDHYEIVPRPGANLTPEQYTCALSQIRCVGE